MLQTYTGYPINVEVCVITNAPERLTNVMHTRWNFTSVSLCGARREMTHAFQLAWEHRDIMELAYEKGEATDTCVDLIIGSRTLHAHCIHSDTLTQAICKQPCMSG